MSETEWEWTGINLVRVLQHSGIAFAYNDIDMARAAAALKAKANEQTEAAVAKRTGELVQTVSDLRSEVAAPVSYTHLRAHET